MDIKVENKSKPAWGLQKWGDDIYLRVDRLKTAKASSLGWARYSLPKGIMIDQGNDDYCRPTQESLKTATTKAKRIAPKVDLSIGKAVLDNNLFVRFGDIPKSKQSKNYATGAIENGVSVYAANYDVEKNVIGINFYGFFGSVFTLLDRPCLLYTSPSPRDRQRSRMPSSA